MQPRIIKSEDQYKSYLSEVSRLAALDPDLDSDEGARLELLAKLIEDYEEERFKFENADPVDAIEFRMEQQGLRQKDLAIVLGGKNRASEVLSRKRALSLSMIRALHEKLNIPTELLIRQPKATYGVTSEIDESEVPVSLLATRGWLNEVKSVHELMQRFFAPAGSPVLLKHTITFGSNEKTNRTHVWLWLSRVRELAEARVDVQRNFRADQFGRETLSYVAKLSCLSNGPKIAKDYLEQQGIVVVIEPHLPSTHLDGAALLSKRGSPIIGLTLRADRLDNFWFTLMHELVHAWKHLNETDRRAIADENVESTDDVQEMEQEANELASELFIPKAVWKRSDAFRCPSTKAILALASQLQISPAIVAGRLRHEKKNYSLFSGLVGLRKSRSNFVDVRW